MCQRDWANKFTNTHARTNKYTCRIVGEALPSLASWNENGEDEKERETLTQKRKSMLNQNENNTIKTGTVPRQESYYTSI